MAENWNCDGGGPHTGSPVKLYRLGPKGGLHGNLILCRACWERENAYNRQRGREVGAPERFEPQDWTTAEVYQS